MATLSGGGSTWALSPVAAWPGGTLEAVDWVGEQLAGAPRRGDLRDSAARSPRLAGPS